MAGHCFIEVRAERVERAEDHSVDQILLTFEIVVNSSGTNAYLLGNLAHRETFNASGCQDISGGIQDCRFALGRLASRVFDLRYGHKHLPNKDLRRAMRLNTVNLTALT